MHLRREPLPAARWFLPPTARPRAPTAAEALTEIRDVRSAADLGRVGGGGLSLRARTIKLPHSDRIVLPVGSFRIALRRERREEDGSCTFLAETGGWEARCRIANCRPDYAAGPAN